MTDVQDLALLIEEYKEALEEVLVVVQNPLIGTQIDTVVRFKDGKPLIKEIRSQPQKPDSVTDATSWHPLGIFDK